MSVIIAAPDLQTITTWATAIATIIILVRQMVDHSQLAKNTKLTENTNQLVNGQHGTALDTVAAQQQQIAALTGTEADAQKALDAIKAATDHRMGNIKDNANKKPTD